MKEKIHKSHDYGCHQAPYDIPFEQYKGIKGQYMTESIFNNEELASVQLRQRRCFS